MKRRTIRDALVGLRADMTDEEARRMATWVLKPPGTWTGLTTGEPPTKDEKAALEALAGGASLNDPLP